MHNGFIVLFRTLTEWQWYTTPNMVQLWIHLLLSANVKPKKWKEIEIERGQLVTSVKTLTDQTGLTTQQVRSALQHLQKTGEIAVKSTNKFTLITICKYALYQDYDGGGQQTNNKQITNEQQTNNKQTTNKQQRLNNDNNDNNDNKETNLDSGLCLTALSSVTTPPTNSVGDIFSDFENSEITENKPPYSDTTEEVEIEKEKDCAEKEKANFDDTATNTTAVVQVIQPAEKMPQTEKNTANTANTQLLLTCLTEDSTAVVRWEETRKWFNEQVRFTKIPPVRVLNPKRKEQFSRCLRQFGRDMIRQAVQMAAKCKFLNGDNDRGWRADFDFIFNINKLPRIVEGFYDKQSKPDAAAVVVQQIAEAGSVEKFNEGNPLFDPNFFKNYFNNKK